MYFHIITNFFKDRKVFLKLEGQTNRKNKPKFLNITFLDTFCIYSRKMEKNGGCALMHPILHTFDTAYAEN